MPTPPIKPTSATHDGYLRLRLDDLLGLSLQHLMSAVDMEPTDQRQCGMATEVCGYTEFVSDGAKPAVSLGWDWRFELERPQLSCARIGWPRSNVMLIDRRCADMGWDRNLVLLASVVDALPWRTTTREAVLQRYGHRPT
jgi:hypothetical protein